MTEKLEELSMASRNNTPTGSLVPKERVVDAILLIRGHNVLLDSDLAALYGVETGALTRAVRRNIKRFPPDFMFQLTKQEFENLKRHSGISSGWGGRRYPPYAFTEQVLRCFPACCTASKPCRSISKL
jgi:hypothetical protein